jgi:hypothetical protein
MQLTSSSVVSIRFDRVLVLVTLVAQRNVRRPWVWTLCGSVLSVVWSCRRPRTRRRLRHSESLF